MLETIAMLHAYTMSSSANMHQNRIRAEAMPQFRGLNRETKNLAQTPNTVVV